MNDNQLLENFFQQARQQQIADQEFTDSVMQRLPQTAVHRKHSLMLSRLWTLACMLTAAVLFVVLGGWDILVSDLTTLAATFTAKYHPLSILAALVVLSWIGTAEAARRARYYI